MPFGGHLRHGIVEPFYIYSLIAKINNKGKFDKYIIVDEKSLRIHKTIFTICYTLIL